MSSWIVKVFILDKRTISKDSSVSFTTNNPKGKTARVYYIAEKKPSKQKKNKSIKKDAPKEYEEIEERTGSGL